MTGSTPATAPPATCQNCGRVLMGSHCHGCGQAADVHRSFAKEMIAILRSMINVDSRALRTIVSLVFRPGKLTRDFVYGKRVGLLPPFTLFITSVFFLFTFFNLFVGPTYFAQKQYSKAELLVEAEDSLQDALEMQGETLERLQQLRKNTAQDQTPAAEHRLMHFNKDMQSDQARVDRARQRLALVQALPDGKLVGTGDPFGMSYSYKGESLLGGDAQDLLFEIDAVADNSADPIVEQRVDLARKFVRIAMATGQHGTIWDKVTQIVTLFAPHGFTATTPWPALNERMTPNLKDPAVFVHKFASSAQNFAILIVPASLPFICLLLAWKREARLYDHVVFTLYASAFLVLAFICFAILAHWIAWADLLDYMIIAYVVHLFVHLKGAYQLRFGTALGLTGVFGIFFAPIAILLFFSGVVFFTAI
ncbi:hypothetical protein PbB2_01519 [Candidatus Phycosocius bacilliformis]|uniref:DUF3667 domain-containing protein n=1 Tax=Candidatus Phycosocius bacilliformis TaxID=1445552 RepID=A0A2P2E9V6_9PROT|nr:DUF3667 domain-containing protein [Candidatus Phycosocius bacilliformis]GBF57849.1 hypothetical protein PbB2_01519 [Candidatus Phycosocius bacilliformis]